MTKLVLISVNLYLREPLTRVKRRGLISKSANSLLPNMANIRNFEFSSEAKNQIRQQEKIISEIKLFAENKYDYKMTDEAVEASLVAFLKDYDLEILFASEDQGLLPEVSASKKDKFIIYKFICMANESEPTIFSFIVDIAIGNLMANSLFYRDFSKFVGKLRDVSFYLDTPFIFRLIGLEGSEKASVYEGFIKTLHTEGAFIKLFRHTYEEAYEILEDCLNWVENISYDPSKASAILRYFVENKYTRIDVQRFINRIDTILSNNYIKRSDIIDKPNIQEFQNHNEDETKIQELIVGTYKESNPLFDEIEKKVTLRRDVDSITSIYLLRKGKIAKHIKDAGHIFMTTNAAIAHAARQYELSRDVSKYSIPACLTDTFVGTILWLQSPAKIFEINRRKIIADCYAALKPDAKLMKKFLAEVEKFRSEDQIDENAYYFLRRDSIVFNLLEDKTMGDAESFDSSVLTDIYNKITSEIKKEASEKYLEEKGLHQRTQNKYDSLERKHKQLFLKLEKRASQISKILSNGLAILLALIIIFGISIQIIHPLLEDTPNLKKGIIILYSFLSILNIIFGFNIFGFKQYLNDKINKLIIKIFSDSETT